MIMGLRLLRRGSATAGRHSRAVPGPLVPGAAAALVAAADRWDDVAPPAVAAPLPVAPVLLEAVPDRPAPAPLPAVGEAATPSIPVLTGAPVSLGFADGAHVDLPADDPRVRTFRAAAAALLESPRA